MVRTLSNIGSAIVGMGMGMGMGMGAVVVGGCRCYSDSPFVLCHGVPFPPMTGIAAMTNSIRYSV